jgi:hypothetical protein
MKPVAGLCGGNVARALQCFGREDMRSQGWGNVEFQPADVDFTLRIETKTKESDAAD